MGFIYKITNSVTGKCYIGETMRKDPLIRFKSHKNVIRRGGGCPALRDAFKKHGEENFTFEVLLECPNNERLAKEAEYIQLYNSMVPNGYNLRMSSVDNSGFKHTEETKAKISESSKKHANDPETRKKYKEGIKKYWENPENKKKHGDSIRNSQKHKESMKNVYRIRGNGGKQLDSIKEKISNSLKEYHKKNPEKSLEMKSKIGKAQEKPLIQYDREGKMIRKFKSTKEASEVLDISAAAISHVLHGRAKTSGGFVWKFDTKTT